MRSTARKDDGTIVRGRITAAVEEGKAVTDWVGNIAGLQELEDRFASQLGTLKPTSLPAGSVLFRPGDEVGNFVLVRSGRIDVYLTARSGREILLYNVSPGETCLQTTLGLLGEDDYSGEAVAASDIEIVLVPRSMFGELIDTSATFRKFVFHAFAARLQAVMQVLERVAFIKIEERLAGALLERVGPEGLVEMTHQELAVAIGSAREVVSRRLQAFENKGWVSLDRGTIRVDNLTALKALVG